MSESDLRPGYVYRAFAADGALLYVGASTNPGSRFAAHQSQTEWWGDVATVAVERFTTRLEALAAEGRAIVNEKPRLNVMVSRRLLTPEEAALHAVSVAERQAERAREVARWQHEHWLANSFVPPYRVHCTNCGRCPERLPKGKTLEQLICKRCRCGTLRRVPTQRLRSVAPPGQEPLDLGPAYSAAGAAA